MASVEKLAPVPTLSDLLADPEKVSAMPKEAVAELRGQLARLDTLLLAHLLTGEQSQPDTDGGDRLLTAAGAAGKLGATEDWLYRHANTLPFAVRVGKKHLRFSEAGIGRYIRQRMVR
jgi:predicted DNA-binding transcriptional regulator AlpA